MILANRLEHFQDLEDLRDSEARQAVAGITNILHLAEGTGIVHRSGGDEILMFEFYQII